MGDGSTWSAIGDVYTHVTALSPKTSSSVISKRKSRPMLDVPSQVTARYCRPPCWALRTGQCSNSHRCRENHKRFSGGHRSLEVSPLDGIRQRPDCVLGTDKYLRGMVSQHACVHTAHFADPPSLVEAGLGIRGVPQDSSRHADIYPVSNYERQWLYR